MDGPTPSRAAKSTEYNRIDLVVMVVLRGVLYPKVHVNVNSRKKKKKNFKGLRPLSWTGTLITSAPPTGHYHPVLGKFSTHVRDPAVDVPGMTGRYSKARIDENQQLASSYRTKNYKL